MKRFLVISLSLLMIFLVGCGEDNVEKNKEVKISDKISSMEFQLDNNIFTLTDKLTYKDFESKGYTVTDEYKEILDKELEASENADNINSESYTIKDKEGKQIALSAINLTDKTQKVKDCTVYFVTSYDGKEYNHSYTLPAGVKFNDSADEIEKKLGKANIDMRDLEMGKIMQYILSGKGTFTVNLNNDYKLTTFSYVLDNSFMFESK